jgi:hypothetical protein
MPRQIAMYLCKIADERVAAGDRRSFGGKHHSTVIHSIRKIEDLRSATEISTRLSTRSWSRFVREMGRREFSTASRSACGWIVGSRRLELSTGSAWNTAGTETGPQPKSQNYKG